MTNVKVGNERLLRLAAFLDQLPPERFDYHVWASDELNSKQDLSCGTTACALGWATTMPEFKELGLRLRYSEAFGAWIEDRDGNVGSRAAEDIFVLSAYDAESLFIYGGLDPDSDQEFTPKYIANMMREFVLQRGDET